MKQQITIREMRLEDAPSVAGLSGELGYAVTADDMARRFRLIDDSGNQAVFVACAEDAVVGWIDVVIVHRLTSGLSGEIGGLVVSSSHQGRGVGHLLVRRAEEWMATHDVKKIVVRSRLAREQAHSFYLKNGYTEWKRQVAFSKAIQCEP